VSVPSGDEAHDPWILLGHVARPHGIRGGLRLHLENPNGEAMREGVTVRLELKGKARSHLVERLYGQGLLQLEGIATREAAEGLRGAAVLLRRSELPPLDDDEAYLIDLLGAEVRDEAGKVLGTLVAFSDNGAQPLAEVKTASGIVLVPFVPPLVVDANEVAGVVVLAPPEGLFEGEAVELLSPPGDDFEAPQESEP
jgi:16S rRNA processing protein RimM